MKEDICHDCHGTGWILEKIKKREIARRCRCFQESKSQFLLEQANIPKRYEHCSFENFESEHHESFRHALKISKQFIKNYPVQDIGLLYIGPCGVGKTHLAVAFIRELLKEKNAPCYFCDFRELIKKIQGSYTPDSLLSEPELLTPIFQKDVLVLDELGAKRTSAWVEETVFYIINNRYNNKKLTLFTSNYLDHGEDEEDTRDSFFKKGEDTLLDRIGIRLRSRIYEMCKVVNMEGDDYRKKIKQASYRY